MPELPFTPISEQDIPCPCGRWHHPVVPVRHPETGEVRHIASGRCQECAEALFALGRYWVRARWEEADPIGVAA